MLRDSGVLRDVELDRIYRKRNEKSLRTNARGDQYAGEIQPVFRFFPGKSQVEEKGSVLY